MAIVLAHLCLLQAHAQTRTAAPDGAYPNRPIRIIVPFSAGSGSDFLARALAPKIAEHWGQQVVVDNRPSAGGTGAGEIVARATPDGHTLMVTSSAIASSAALYPKLPYDTVNDFAGVSQIAGAAVLLAVSSGLGVKTVKELIALAQQKPGQLTIGSLGIGSGSHYAGELFKLAAGINLVHVPYKGASEVLTDTIGGRLNLAMVPMLPAVPLVRSGRLLGLGVTSSTRTPSLPDMPTVAESGLPGYEYEGWFGMFAPRKTPARIITDLSAEVARILAQAEIRDRILNLATTPKASTPQALNTLVRSEIETRRKIFKDAGTRPE